MTALAKQRFVGLTVGEISVVDTPAVDVEFLVMKRQEDKMENTQTAEPGAATAEIQTDANNSTTLVSKTIDGIRGIIGDIAKITGTVNVAEVAKAAEPPAKAKKAEPDDEDDEDDDEDVKTAKAADKKRAWAEAQLKAAGVEGDALKKAMAKYDKDFPPFGGKPVAKSAEASTEATPDANAEAMSAIQETLKALNVEITKAKTITPKRQEALKAIATQLVSLMKELGMEEVPHCVSPDTKVGEGTLGASGIDISKKLDTLLTDFREAMAETTTTTKSLADRVAAIEETRAAPKSADANANTEPAPVKKSLWAGIV